MADSAITLPGTGTLIDTRTIGTDHRQVLVIGDPTNNAGVAPVDAVNGLTVQMAATSPGIIATGTPGAPATTNVLTVQGAASMTPVFTADRASAAASGLTTTRVTAAATTNATLVKGSPGNIGEIDVFNNAAYTVFLKLFNKATAPTPGTDTPVWTIPIASGGGYSKSFPHGKSFTVGIGYSITKNLIDSDVTALALNDVTGSIDWI